MRAEKCNMTVSEVREANHHAHLLVDQRPHATAFRRPSRVGNPSRYARIAAAAHHCAWQCPISQQSPAQLARPDHSMRLTTYRQSQVSSTPYAKPAKQITARFT